MKDKLALLLATLRDPRALTVAAILILLLIWMMYPLQNAQGLRHITEEVTKGDLEVSVSATGNLFPTNQVDVGSELSGIVERVLVDENDRVQRGQVLAQLDLSKLNDQVSKSQAAVLAAEAQLAQAQATMKETAANLERQRRVYELSGGKVPSQLEMDGAEAALLRAEASESSARAAAAQAAATLRSDRTNLSKASIRSPIDGIVLTRKIEPGQTVAASLQAPVLFTLAEDLALMELQVNVDEADVSQVRPGQPASFTVDAWPGRKYPAEITRVGFGAQTTEGVVTYKTILKVSNRDLSLRPGMTATADISVASRKDVLLVPNAALRFTPQQNGAADKSSSFLSSLTPRMRSQPRQAKVKTDEKNRQVWILRDGKPATVPVETGLSNGRYTEVLGGELQPGMAVITGTQKTAK